MRECSVNNEWCEGPVRKKSGYCERHHHRSATNVPLDAPFPVKEKVCKYANEDCNRYYAKGMCKFHYHRIHMGKDPLEPKVRLTQNVGKECAHEGCGRMASNKGLCHTHNMQLHTAGETWEIGARKRGNPTGECKVDGCDLPVHRHQRCARHWEEHRDRNVPNAKSQKECALPFCDKPARKRPESRLCSTDAKRLATFSIDEDQLLEMFKDGRCELCGSTYKLSIDHDHKCCPGNYSCGKCIRGVLCGNCNMGIGNLSDDPAVLRKAADYIEANSKPA